MQFRNHSHPVSVCIFRCRHPESAHVPAFPGHDFQTVLLLQILFHRKCDHLHPFPVICKIRRQILIPDLFSVQIRFKYACRGQIQTGLCHRSFHLKEPSKDRVNILLRAGYPPRLPFLIYLSRLKPAPHRGAVPRLISHADRHIISRPWGPGKPQIHASCRH